MKATYTKPLMAVESFSTMQTTPRDCAEDVPLNTADIEVCAWDTGYGVTVFTSSTVCQLVGAPDDFICYNNPSEGNYVFHS